MFDWRKHNTIHHPESSAILDANTTVAQLDTAAGAPDTDSA
jgi:hypothetical protein